MKIIYNHQAEQINFKIKSIDSIQKQNVFNKLFVLF